MIPQVLEKLYFFVQSVPCLLCGAFTEARSVLLPSVKSNRKHVTTSKERSFFQKDGEGRNALKAANLASTYAN